MTITKILSRLNLFLLGNKERKVELLICNKHKIPVKPTIHYNSAENCRHRLFG